MLYRFDYHFAGTNSSAPKYDRPSKEPEPSQEELLARNSFPSVNENKYLTKLLEKQK